MGMRQPVPTAHALRVAVIGSLAVGVAIGFVGARSPSHVFIEQTTAYLSPWGPKTLPALALKYDSGRISLKPGALLRTDDPFLATQPVVSWDHIPTTIAPALADAGMILSLFFIDFGFDPDLQVIQKEWTGFRYVHALWTDCMYGSIDGCRPIKPYLQPGNLKIGTPNRYTFLLVAHPKPLVIRGQPVVDNTVVDYEPSIWQDFDLTQLAEENPGLTPVGYTYMQVRLQFDKRTAPLMPCPKAE